MRISLTISLKRALYIIAHFLVTIQLNSCFLKQDRTTTVYGTITDQSGAPIDSILVIMQGAKSMTYYETLHQVYTDEDGKYELLLDLAKKYHSIDIGMPFWLDENPKYVKLFKINTIHKDDNRTNNCCKAIVGKKTKYDFQLIRR